MPITLVARCSELNQSCAGCYGSSTLSSNTSAILLRSSNCWSITSPICMTLRKSLPAWMVSNLQGVIFHLPLLTYKDLLDRTNFDWTVDQTPGPYTPSDDAPEDARSPITGESVQGFLIRLAQSWPDKAAAAWTWKDSEVITFAGGAGRPLFQDIVDRVALQGTSFGSLEGLKKKASLLSCCMKWCILSL